MEGTYFKMVIGLALLIVTGCGKSQGGLQNGEGFIAVTGGKIWYRVTGQGDKTPILLLHGGPGYPSQYLNALNVLGKERKVITFDQLGCGRSDRIKDTTVMTIKAYVAQVGKLLDTLEVRDVNLYGHSWGTILALEYYLKHPEGIKSLVMASPCFDSQLWQADSDSLISMLPDSTKTVLRNNIAGISQDSTKLADAINVFFGEYYFRKQPPSADVDSTLSQVGEDVYNYMWGTNEFFVTGTLKDYNRTKNLRDIKVPTLYIGGEYDPARPVTLRYYQGLTPNSEVVVIPDAGHITMNDNPAAYTEAISAFLTSADKQ